jgi:hypothetical protein
LETNIHTDIRKPGKIIFLYTTFSVSKKIRKDKISAILVSFDITLPDITGSHEQIFLVTWTDVSLFVIKDKDP